MNEIVDREELKEATRGSSWQQTGKLPPRSSEIDKLLK